MHQVYLLGIDGGGTHCRARLTDPQGHILARAQGGSANVFSDFGGATAVVETLVGEVFRQAGLPQTAFRQTTCVAGLAGANVPSVARALAQWRSPAEGFHCCSDVEIACMGAHQGAPGAVLVLGTGSQGAAWDGERFNLVGGWGFVLSDHGSGADLGRRALRQALLAHEAVIAATGLTRQLMDEFNNSAETLLLWARRATPADWGRFAPAIFAAAGEGDRVAASLIARSVSDIELLIAKLESVCRGRIVLMGGLAAPILPWLPDATRDKIVPAQSDALNGALLMARYYAGVGRPGRSLC
ncbi:BadF/BadG/BcrA/BcrD ATPase family protein [Martelella alba]|uniref:N-acetylglucosamine kinase n=1 Tax=Martelella alba TaxID=2590451 RepID=A0ABY2SIZ7_9HYPH|nr:BadF/BadG/BcrA/BcrD ATPase family protein [Martelella alba]TKI05236.1 N-acetylglucosamine kinase [Martelella alba]